MRCSSYSRNELSMQTLAAIGLPFIPGTTELRPFVADLWLILTIVGVLLAPLFAQRANFLCGVVSLVGVTLAFLSQIAFASGDAVVGEHFRGMLVADQFAAMWKLLLLLFVAGVIVMWFTTVAST